MMNVAEALFFKKEDDEMREIIYLAVIMNVIVGFLLIYKRPRPFKGRTFKDYK